MHILETKFKITYPDYANGNGMSQYKYLISHNDYIEDIKPKYNEIAILEAEQTNYGKKNEKYKTIGQKISEIKSYIKNRYGDEFFTDKSPLWLRDGEGYMTLPSWQGGKHKVILEICK